MTDTTTTPPHKNAPGRGRPVLPIGTKKRRVQLHVNPALAAYLEAEEQPAGLERIRTARRRKQEAAEALLAANIESRIV